MHTSSQIIKAKTLLGLSDKATLSQVKVNYKNLIHKWHPDKNTQDIDLANKMSSQINEAYKIVLEYIKNYSFPFDEETVSSSYRTPDEWWHNQFGTNTPNK